jgi:hypothetical protein
MSQTLANPGDNSRRLALGAKQTPRSLNFATLGFKLREPHSLRTVESRSVMTRDSLPKRKRNEMLRIRLFMLKVQRPRRRSGMQRSMAETEGYGDIAGFGILSGN